MSHPPLSDTRRAEDDAARLIESLHEIEPLMARLSALLPETGGSGPQTGVINRHAPGASEPWQSEAAGTYWTIHAGLREVANDMRIDVGMREKTWNGSDRTTDEVLTAIHNYLPVVSDRTLRESARRVQGWVTSAKQIRDVDEEERWTPVPRMPGARPPACPYCRTFSLRMASGRGEVRCFLPGCKDKNGEPTRARMELGRLTGDGILVFADDTTIHYRGEDS